MSGGSNGFHQFLPGETILLPGTGVLWDGWVVTMADHIVNVKGMDF